MPAGPTSLTRDDQRPTWDEYFMLLAKLAALRSTCLSRPTGAVIVLDRQVLATGYNGSMPGAPHCLDDGRCYRRSVRGEERGKYDICRATHAEANAIAQAARRGVPVAGATVYTTLMPCYVCTKLLASARIQRVVYEHEYESPDAERDALWHKAIAESGMRLERLILSPVTIALAQRFMEGVTSVRRRLDGEGIPEPPPDVPLPPRLRSE